MTFVPAFESTLELFDIQRLGWVLLHFVWQGALVALLLAVSMTMLRRRSPQTRYLVSCLALVLMLLLPAATLSWLRSKDLNENTVSRDVEQVPRVTESDAIADATASTVPTIEVDPEALAPLPEEPLEVAPEPRMPVGRDVPTLGVKVQQRVQPWLPALVAAWLCGVLVLSLRLLMTWRRVQRLRKSGTRPAPEASLSMLDRAAGRLRVRRVVTLLESTLVEIPTVIGWLRPVILLPVTAVSGLTGSQLEAILVHELAHIRRADYLVNLLQSVVEILLFYHPAVWWVSNRIRNERELCCDDMATDVSGDAVGYAAALVRMEELRQLPASVALAATGGSLLSRVRRLLGISGPDRLSGWWLSSVIALLIAGGTLTAFAMRHSHDIADLPNDLRGSAGMSVLVCDGGDRPFPGAKVIVSRWEDGQAGYRHELKTDDEGRFRLTGLAAGQWLVSIDPVNGTPTEGQLVTLDRGVIERQVLGLEAEEGWTAWLLDHDLQVELLTIADPQNDEHRHWQPDGTIDPDTLGALLFEHKFNHWDFIPKPINDHRGFGIRVWPVPENLYALQTDLRGNVARKGGSSSMWGPTADPVTQEQVVRYWEWTGLEGNDPRVTLALQMAIDVADDWIELDLSSLKIEQRFGVFSDELQKRAKRARPNELLAILHDPKASTKPGGVITTTCVANPQVVLNGDAVMVVEVRNHDGQLLNSNMTAGGQGYVEHGFDVEPEEIGSVRYQVRYFTHEVVFENVSLIPGQPSRVTHRVRRIPRPPQADELLALAEAKSADALAADDANAANDVADMTPADYADAIETAIKQYKSVEYSADLKLKRNTRAFQPEPLFVEGDGSVQYRGDGTRWFVHETGFSYRYATTQKTPKVESASYDGTVHHHFDGRRVTVGQEESHGVRLDPRELFWKAGISREWLLGALRRPEARIEQITKNDGEHSVKIVSEWTPEWSETKRTFTIVLRPDRAYLPVKVLVEYDDRKEADWTIERLKQAESGLWYPAVIRNERTATDSTPLSVMTVNEFKSRSDFADSEFRVAFPFGVDILDYRIGRTWHHDPSWQRLQPFLTEKLNWPQPGTSALRDLKSYCDPELSGKAAPTLKVAEWLLADDDAAAGRWDRADRHLTVLQFIGGRSISPTPNWISALTGLNQRYRDLGVEIIAIASHSRTPDMTRAAIREMQPQFAVALDAQVDPDSANASAVGAKWGQTFMAYGQKAYLGTVIIDRAGNVITVDPQMDVDNSGLSALEFLIRRELQKSRGTADGPAYRLYLLNRASMAMRGIPPAAGDVQAALAATDVKWYAKFIKDFMSSSPAQHRNALKFDGITMNSVLLELSGGRQRAASAMARYPDSSKLLNAEMAMIGAEWKRLAAQPGTGSISGHVDLPAATPGTNATIQATQTFKILQSAISGGWRLFRGRTVKATTDGDGNFKLTGLGTGTWRLTFAAPGEASVERIVYLSKPDSVSEPVNIVMNQSDFIAGFVTDENGDPIVGATVKVTTRHLNPKVPQQTTTAGVPRSAATTDKDGHFRIEKFPTGSFSFEIMAEGFKTSPLKLVPGGTIDASVVLKKL